MKILMLHNFYRHRGGEGVSFAVESAALRSLGHEVDTFSLDNAVDLQAANAAMLAVNTVWCRKSHDRVKEMLSANRYDVLHVQNFFPLFSPSVYDAARACGVPVVQALRNYRLFCMQSGLFRNGAVCEECSNRRHSWAGIRHRCYRDGLGASLTLGAMIEFHRMRKTWNRRVDAFIAVSECVKEKYVANGWDAERMHVKHNTVSPVPGIGTGKGGAFAVAGRLSEDKGLIVLVAAWEHLLARRGGAGMPRLQIIGDGPLLGELRSLVREKGLAPFIEMTGRLSLKETYDAIGDAVASIQPSVRYEPCSRTIAESYAKGTPVIAARIGGAVELVEHGVSGFHFPPGDAAALASAVATIMENPPLAEGMRANARAKFDREFAPEINARQLVGIYEAAIGRARLSR